MLMNKKYLLLLLSVPMYACYLYIGSLFLMFRFRSSECVEFLLFIIATVVILTVKKEIIKALCVFVLHLMVLVWSFLSEDPYFLDKQQILLYCQYYVPALLLLEMIAATDPQLFAGRRGENQKEFFSDASRSIVFYVYLVVLIFVLLFETVRGLKKIDFSIDETGVYFCLLFLFSFFCRRNVSAKKAKDSQKLLPIVNMLCVITAFSAFTCILFVERFSIVNYKLWAVFPTFLVIVVFCEKYQTAKKEAFSLEKAKQ